jgi:hypothetical protein
LIKLFDFRKKLFDFLKYLLPSQSPAAAAGSLPGVPSLGRVKYIKYGEVFPIHKNSFADTVTTEVLKLTDDEQVSLLKALNQEDDRADLFMKTRTIISIE